MTSSLGSADRHVYFDNAATSFPKPRAVVDAVVEYMTSVGGNPGRSGHSRSVGAGEAVFAAREAAAALFGVTNPMRVIFGSNATAALNLAIQGILREGDHAVTTAIEHNSTIRPLMEMERRGVAVTVVSCPAGIVDRDEFERSIRPETKLAVVNHASNAFGILQPIAEIGSICKRRGVILLADCAQTAGVIPIAMKDDHIDLLAFAGHKGLYGPTGTGGLAISDGFDHSLIRPLAFGGTGSNSDSVYQPDFLPDRFESGTVNAAGISGLCAGIRHIASIPDGIRGVQSRKRELVNYFIRGAEECIRGFMTYAPPGLIETGVVSFNIAGMEPSDVAFHLAESHGVMCRSGLHCAPLAHRTMGTFPRGTVRFSFGIFNTKDEIDFAIGVLDEISRAWRAHE
ncbi:MAG: hypothetical protein A2176_09355 [Spirochaetes bacterium RBG_13_51_14]|nr:MAG: hypothetical protein A2176_09355 [Spirochaetes bacterium RBG_13_51_14]